MESPRRYGVLTLCLFENELGTQRRIIGVALFRPSIKSRFVRRVEWRVQAKTLRQVWIRDEQPPKRHRIGQVLGQGLRCRRAIEAVGDNQRPLKLRRSATRGTGAAP